MQLVETRVDVSIVSSSQHCLSGTSPSEAEGSSRQSDSGHFDTASPGSPLPTKKKRPRHIDSKYQPEWFLK